MAENNRNDNWRERMSRIEEMMERNWLAHDRMERNVAGLHTSLLSLKNNTDKLVTAIRELIDPIPPENLR